MHPGDQLDQWIITDNEKGDVQNDRRPKTDSGKGRKIHLRDSDYGIKSKNKRVDQNNRQNEQQHDNEHIFAQVSLNTFDKVDHNGKGNDVDSQNARIVTVKKQAEYDRIQLASAASENRK